MHDCDRFDCFVPESPLITVGIHFHHQPQQYNAVPRVHALTPLSARHQPGPNGLHSEGQMEVCLLLAAAKRKKKKKKKLHSRSATRTGEAAVQYNSQMSEGVDRLRESTTSWTEEKTERGLVFR